MIQTITLSEHAEVSPETLRDLIPRAALDISHAQAQVRPLIAEVQHEGERALRRHAEQFEAVTNHALRVPEADIRRALDDCDPELRTALEMLGDKLTRASQAQVPPETVTEFPGGATIRQRWQPVERVGLYVPGGKAVYPSSVMMNAVSAQVAGVPSLAIASPVQKDFGGVHPTILAAAALLGVTEVYAIGGASAIAAFTYGVPEIDLAPVDVITGPGNVFVAAAKREVSGQVGIDSEAGTTEILILADATANARFVAADLLSQAEHDEAAASVLVTDSEDLARDVTKALEELVARTAHRDRATTALGGPQSAIILVRDMRQGVQVSNVYAPEHLEILTADPEATLRGITNAGAVFLGEYTPVSLGDYLAGSNHVLPTGGTARFASGLGAHTFLRPQQIVTYGSNALRDTEPHIRVLATAEGLPAHADAVSTRF